MTGDDEERAGEAAVRDRNPAQGGTGYGCAHAGNDLDGHAGCGERQCFLAAAAEDERVAALEPHDPLAAERAPDHHALDRLLRDRVPAGALAHVRPTGLRRVLQGRAIDERVVQDEIRFLKPLDRFDGQQLGVAGACANQRDETRHR